MIESSRLYRAVRAFAVSVPVWGTAIRFQTLPEHRWDLTLVSQAVYGNRDEFLTVMAAAGLDRLDQELTEQVLILPTPAQLDQMKRRAGIDTGKR